MGNYYVALGGEVAVAKKECYSLRNRLWRAGEKTILNAGEQVSEGHFEISDIKEKKVLQQEGLEKPETVKAEENPDEVKAEEKENPDEVKAKGKFKWK